MRSAFVQTASGRYLDVQDPQPDDIDIADIAHHLAHLCRFGGACRQYYSEAEHAVRMAEILPPRLKLAGLLYGAAKAYAGEAVRPGGRPVRAATQADGGGGGALRPAPVGRRQGRAGDGRRRLLATERRDLMPPDNIEWPILTGVQPLAERIWPMTIAQALASFCAVYEQCRAWSSSAQIRLRQPSVR
ncbi:Uncharacterised protein [Chromobacterium violaceum]|uniref:Phosphohydrolase n=1 Tax=Chromobacterium violaceum TaxID=536 RepID=A0A3S4JTC9_CHRVL|nr:Uncharacterised protein [Chromobacterium violaceum]